MPRHVVGESFRYQGQRYLPGSIFTHDDPLPEGISKFLAGTAPAPPVDLAQKHMELQVENTRLQGELATARSDLQTVNETNKRLVAEVTTGREEINLLKQQLAEAQEKPATDDGASGDGVIAPNPAGQTEKSSQPDKKSTKGGK